jgi:hypothetical protein
MAKIELRDATIYFRDGLAGTAAVNNVAGLVDGVTEADILSPVLNTTVTTDVPVGARFTVVGEATAVIHTVTAVTDTGPTTNFDFTPAIATGSSIVDTAVITFISQEIEVKIGDGNLTYVEAKNYNYELDRGSLDTVREGDDIPVALTLAFVYEFVRTGTAETITPSDAIKGIGGAAGWVSTSTDKCEPYAVDMVVEHVVACSGAANPESEFTTFPDTRYDQLSYDLGAASISVTARSFATEATVTRQ